jgi:hypothetical protein
VEDVHVSARTTSWNLAYLDVEHVGAEHSRLEEDARREKPWRRWGPYLPERQWGTVREDYSPGGTAWEAFPHDHARSRAYRWGEDGLLGICDRECRLALAIALWNERDPILKERLFGLTGHEGNHGEDVKELYYYLDATPTASYLKALYKYPQNAYPYSLLVDENRRRTKCDPEFEVVDTSVFDENRYFDVLVEYAKAAPDDVLLRVTVTNRGPDPARVHVLPTVWCRNTWSWGGGYEADWGKPVIEADGDWGFLVDHSSLGRYRIDLDETPAGRPTLVFTDNETNMQRLFGFASRSRFTKDAFHEYVVDGRADAVNPERRGTKAAGHYILDLAAGDAATVRARLREDEGFPYASFGGDFDRVFAARIAEADSFYLSGRRGALAPEARNVARQAYAGLIWSKQFYYYSVRDWLGGDPAQPRPPARYRNADWPHLFNRDVISMPDKWEYPWYAAWDLAFHMLPFARIDPEFAKQQLVLLLREWYMHPNGQIPAYEWAFSDVNPPVHAWAAWRVYKITAPRGERDVAFLARIFDKLLLNFTWWVNRKDAEGRHLFAGGFLGLDNIGVFDRSSALPMGGRLEQADGTAWMAFYAATMLSMALELAAHRVPGAEDLASKFFEHFIWIVDAINTFGGTGLWDDEDGFYYDQLYLDGQAMPLKLRSLVGVLPLIAIKVLDGDVIDELPDFKRRMQWYLDHRPDLASYVSSVAAAGERRLLSVPTRERLVRALRYVFDEDELLSPYGIRSLSRRYVREPYVLHVGGDEHRVTYDPAESTTGVFGGNSNWRGPIWFPINYLFVEALERYGYFYGDSLRIEYPTGSGRHLTLGEVAADLSARLASIFLPGPDGARPCHGDDRRYATDPAFRDLVLFSEYFHGDTGRGVGASHQTGWTATVTRFLEQAARTPA